MNRTIDAGSGQRGASAKFAPERKGDTASRLAKEFGISRRQVIYCGQFAEGVEALAKAVGVSTSTVVHVVHSMKIPNGAVREFRNMSEDRLREIWGQVRSGRKLKDVLGKPRPTKLDSAKGAYLRMSDDERYQFLRWALGRD